MFTDARNIALIFLSLQALVVSLLPLLIISGLAYGIYRLNQVLRHYLHAAQHYARKVHAQVEQISEAIIRPLIKIQMWTSMMSTITRKLFSRRLI